MTLLYSQFMGARLDRLPVPNAVFFGAVLFAHAIVEVCMVLGTRVHWTLLACNRRAQTPKKEVKARFGPGEVCPG